MEYPFMALLLLIGYMLGRYSGWYDGWNHGWRGRGPEDFSWWK